MIKEHFSNHICVNLVQNMWRQFYNSLPIVTNISISHMKSCKSTAWYHTYRNTDIVVKSWDGTRLSASIVTISTQWQGYKQVTIVFTLLSAPFCPEAIYLLYSSSLLFCWIPTIALKKEIHLLAIQPPLMRVSLIDSCQIYVCFYTRNYEDEEVVLKIFLFTVFRSTSIKMYLFIHKKKEYHTQWYCYELT